MNFATLMLELQVYEVKVKDVKCNFVIMMKFKSIMIDKGEK